MQPTFEVQVDGNPISGVTEVVASFALGENGNCQVSGVGVGGTARQTLVAYAGWDGATDLMFNGECTRTERALWPRKNVLTGQDRMAYLRNKWGNGYFEYVAQTAGAIETNLIEKSGIDVSLHVVVDSGRMIGSVGNELKLRDGTPIGLDPNQGTADVPLDLINHLLKADLYYIASRSNGAIYIDAMAVGSPIAAYSQGQPIRSFSWDDGNPNDIRNKWLVKGLEILGFAYAGTSSAASSYLVAPFEYNSGDDLVLPYLESDADCAAVADAYVAFYNRLIPSCQFTVDGNLDIQPGTTVRFTVPGAGLSSATDFFIQRVTHTIGSDFTTSGQGMAI